MKPFRVLVAPTYGSASLPPQGRQSPCSTKHGGVVTILKDPAFLEKFIKPQAYIAGDLSREQFAAQVKSDYKKWGELVKISGVTIE